MYSEIMIVVLRKMLIWDEKARPSFSIIKNYLDTNLDKKFFDKFCNIERNYNKESSIN